ncbi:MAG TPA: hypothetical protein PKD83_02945 [Ignavibacteria bacterium]|nr:hypothetical protein [Ignavibacteria bacterium]
MKDLIKVISDKDNQSVELVNRLSDPGMWIVYIYKKFLFFKIKKSSHWFTNEEEALKFAKEYAM